MLPVFFFVDVPQEKVRTAAIIINNDFLILNILKYSAKSIKTEVENKMATI
jgi:hypothetical protein